ncbi:hypothetical protein PE067_14000 [Paracoccus sp. DMF-8]|uniref:hypothetical protein n=1 Tax=Paracoccus sp. DMF-8 TaxID=3019445 RepID=UPI0023E82498|nr:hypothetical protein [Paracoccus sp. DMF-8]MDF3607148.1 hypothetical protein [Paracoccus sp. DMF-8]
MLTSDDDAKMPVCSAMNTADLQILEQIAITKNRRTAAVRTEVPDGVDAYDIAFDLLDSDFRGNGFMTLTAGCWRGMTALTVRQGDNQVVDVETVSPHWRWPIEGILFHVASFSEKFCRPSAADSRGPASGARRIILICKVFVIPLSAARIFPAP